MNNAVIDLVIRIKNGYLARNEKIDVSYSNFKKEVAEKLQSLGFIKNLKVEGTKIKRLVLELSYEDNQTIFTDVRIYSTPGRRWYVSVGDLKPPIGRQGAAILSTPKGIMTSREAKKMKIGGELLFEIW